MKTTGKNDIIIIDEDKNEKTITKDELTYQTKEGIANFELGFCSTVYKWQGDTIKEPFNIYETQRMSLNEIYTAISRGTCFANINLTYPEGGAKEFRADRPPKPKETVLKAPKTQTGSIYRILDKKTKKLGYVGST